MSTNSIASLPIPQNRCSAIRQSFLKKCTPRKVVFSCIIILYGFLSSLSSMAYYALLKVSYNLEPEKLNTYVWISTLTTFLKPAYGLLTDRVYIRGQHRKPYLIICGLLMAVLYVLIGFALNSAALSSVLMLMANMNSCIVNSVGEALVVEDARMEKREFQINAANNLSIYFFLDGMTMLAMSFLTGVIVNDVPIEWVFLLCAGVSLLIVVCGSLYSEISEYVPKLTVREHAHNLALFFAHKEVYLPMVFVFLYNLDPSIYDAMTYFEMNVLGINFEQLGIIDVMDSIGYIVGIVVYSLLLRKKNIKCLIFYTAIILCATDLLQLFVVKQVNIGFNYYYFLLILNLFSNSVMELALMPVLTLTCMLCPKNNEAFVFDTITGIRDLSEVLSYKLGGFMMSGFGITSTNFRNLWALVLINSVLPLCTLVLLPFIPLHSDYTDLHKAFISQSCQPIEVTYYYHVQNSLEL